MTKAMTKAASATINCGQRGQKLECSQSRCQPGSTAVALPEMVSDSTDW